MENRKLVILFSLLLSLTFSGQAFAYEVGTHAFLTKEVLEFYKKNFSANPILEEFMNSVIQGSIDEDDNIRWMNHFYDPVYNRGLTLPGNWLSSKEWARNNVYQTSITYNPIMRTTIADFLAVTNPEALQTTDYTWERAIKDYLKGDKERAFRGLGQVLHLIEDASVPDHTRNDPHPALNHDDALETGSPYEIWTSNFNLENPDQNLSLRLLNKKPINLDDLNTYFDKLAIYSNNNFYSKDTIGIGEYKSPEPDYFGQDGLYTYGFRKDSVFGDYHLLAYENPPNKYGWVVNNENNLVFKEKAGSLKILPDYWSRLSVKAVQYGAGVIDLFFKEVEKAKNDPNFVKTESKSFFAEIKETAQSVVSDIISTVKDFIGIEKEPAGNLATTVYLDKKENIADNQAAPFSQIVETGNSQPIPQNIAAVNVDNQDEDLAEANAKKFAQPAPVSTSGNGAGNAAMVSAPILSAQPSSNFRQCGFKTDKSPARNNLIINEVAWMGGPVSANDEWLELKNISGKELDISNWQILDKDEQIKINLGSINRTKLGAGEFVLLERTDDNSIPGLTADLIYTGALSNSDEGLRLFDNNCDLADEVLASPDWPAGISDLRKTMERQEDLSWGTYSGNGENFGGVIIMGTPKKENSLPGQGQPATTTLVDEPVLPEPPPAPTLSNIHVVISEVQITGGTGQTTNDFIELYNPTDAAFNLKGHRLVKRTKTGISDTSIKSWTSDEFIPAKGFYLWANSGYTGIAVIPDATTTATIADDNGIALRQGDEDTGMIIDSVAWGEAQNAFVEGVNAAPAGANQSIERKALQNNNCVSASGNGEFLGNNCDTNNNQDDFELRALPRPQNSHSFPEPRSAPTAISNFNANYSSSTLELVLTWGESADYSNGTSTLEYLLSYSTSSPAEFKELAALPATTTYNFRVKEVGLTESFFILAKDKEGLTSIMATTSIVIPSIFQAVYFYPDPRNASTTVIELGYNVYPVITNPFNSGLGYRAILFYKNQDAPAIPEFHYVTQIGGSDPLVDEYGDWGSQVRDAWLLYFPVCTGGGNGTALVLKDLEVGCSPWGGPLGTLHTNQLEDNNLIIPLAASQYSNTQPAAGSYLTIAFYGNGEGSVYSNQNLIVVDRQKYLFQSFAPEHKAPILSGPLNLEFNKNRAQLEVFWPRATDDDSLDNGITYEINYSTTTEFIDANWRRPYFDNFSDKKNVSPGDNLLIGVKAKDDFGNYSIATSTWSWPDADWKIAQDKFNQWSANFGTKNESCYSCTTSASLQRISPEDDFEFNIVAMRLKQETASDAADLRLRIFHNDNFPDFDDELGKAVIKDAFRLDGNSDIIFVFDEPVSLNAGEDYWLVLDVENYGDSRGFYRNAWQNAVNTGEDLYPNGEAGWEPSDICGRYCSLRIPYPNETADWYFKIGLESQ